MRSISRLIDGKSKLMCAGSLSGLPVSHCGLQKEPTLPAQRPPSLMASLFPWVPHFGLWAGFRSCPRAGRMTLSAPPQGGIPEQVLHGSWLQIFSVLLQAHHRRHRGRVKPVHRCFTPQTRLYFPVVSHPQSRVCGMKLNGMRPLKEEQL